MHFTLKNASAKDLDTTLQEANSSSKEKKIMKQYNILLTTAQTAKENVSKQRQNAQEMTEALMQVEQLVASLSQRKIELKDRMDELSGLHTVMGAKK
eukprot:m.243724 g.243724  ORF g.243724 m.243724 type:complete len:97 (+) comp46615_c0_seq1:47-337(+)